MIKEKRRLPSNRLHKPAIIFRGQSCEGARSREPSEHALAGNCECEQSEALSSSLKGCEDSANHTRICRVGLIAQLVERSPCTGEATGSNPVESKQLFFLEKEKLYQKKTASQEKRKPCERKRLDCFAIQSAALTRCNRSETKWQIQ